MTDRSEECESTLFANPVEGRRLRDEGQALVAANVDQQWWDRAHDWLDVEIRRGREFSANDLLQAVGAPSRRNSVGAFFGIASRAGWIRPVGLTSGVRPPQHARRIMVWQATRQ